MNLLVTIMYYIFKTIKGKFKISNSIRIVPHLVLSHLLYFLGTVQGFGERRSQKMAETNFRNPDGRTLERRTKRTNQSVGNAYQKTRRFDPNSVEDTGQGRLVLEVLCLWR